MPSSSPSPAPHSDTPGRRSGPGAWLAALLRRLWRRPASGAVPAQTDGASPAPAALQAGSVRAALPAPSLARTALDYRQDAARHIYARNAARIYPGPLPPLLHAIGVLDVQLDAQGRVLGLDWLRRPRHAPEVVLEIERTVRAAAPWPAPLHLGQVTYTDTWLWDESGRFQLDTLTEGQLGSEDEDEGAGDDKGDAGRPGSASAQEPR